MIYFSDVVFNNANVLINGLKYTLLIWIITTLLSYICGFIFGILHLEELEKPWLRYFITFFCYILRGIPFYIQLLFCYFMIPYWFSFSVSPFLIGIICLGLCSASYTSQTIITIAREIVKKQWKIALGLGYKKKQIICYIVLPQVIRISMGSLLSESDQILKSTSILSSIGIIEMTRAGMNIVAQTMQPGEIYGIIGLIYLLLSSILMCVNYYVQKKWKLL
jgi:His/Glu/Gln/Arg/opine family amino acid ABC transporter permease subunit